MEHSVSVILPTFNGEKYIREAIDSALAQTLFPAEIIVVDDGSTDGTAGIVKEFGDRVTYIYQRNKGTAGAYNTGILAATGEYVAFLEQDDIWMADKNATQVKSLVADEGLGMVFCPVTLMHDDTPSKYYDLDTQGGEGEYSFADFFERNRVLNCSAVMIRRTVFEKVGQFREDLRLAFDYDLWLRIAAEYKVKCQSPALVRYRIHSQNLSRDEHELMAADGNLKALVFWRDSPFARGMVGRRRLQKRIVEAYKRLSWDYAEIGERKQEVRLLWESVKMKPLDVANWREYLWRKIEPRHRRRISWYAHRLKQLLGA